MTDCPLDEVRLFWFLIHSLATDAGELAVVRSVRLLWLVWNRDLATFRRLTTKDQSTWWWTPGIRFVVSLYRERLHREKPAGRTSSTGIFRNIPSPREISKCSDISKPENIQPWPHLRFLTSSRTFQFQFEQPLTLHQHAEVAASQLK